MICYIITRLCPEFVITLLQDKKKNLQFRPRLCREDHFNCLNTVCGQAPMEGIMNGAQDVGLCFRLDNQSARKERSKLV